MALSRSQLGGFDQRSLDMLVALFRQRHTRTSRVKAGEWFPPIHTKTIHGLSPGRPLITWMYIMFVRGAVLDGAAGMAYATLQSFYEYMIVLKTRELERGGA
jgi:hypothetical protein